MAPKQSAGVKTPRKIKKLKQYNTEITAKDNSLRKVEVNFNVVRKAIEILEKPVVNSRTEIRKCADVENERIHFYKTQKQYIRLIERAVLDRSWRIVNKLLIACINDKLVTTISDGPIFNYILILLMNDPIAVKHNLLQEFINMKTSFRTNEECMEFLKKIHSIR